MKTSKRLLSLLLALTMVLSLMGNLSVAAFAEEVTPTVVTTDGNDQPTTPSPPTRARPPPPTRIRATRRLLPPTATRTPSLCPPRARSRPLPWPFPS